MEELELFKEFMFKKYGVKLMQYQINLADELLKIINKEDISDVIFQRGNRDFTQLIRVLEFKLSLKK